MMMFRKVRLLIVTVALLALVNSQEDRDKKEELLTTDDFFVEFSVASPDDDKNMAPRHHSSLRRELQQTVSCRAVSPHTLTSKDCSGLYDCICVGSTETRCAYCEVDTTRGHVCQVTNSSMTFVDPQTSLMKTCSCHYANGHVSQSCYSLADRAQTTNPGGTTYPVPIPPTSPPYVPPYIPPTSPPYVPPYTLPPTEPIPPYQPPVFNCNAVVPGNLLSGDCSGTYACTCGGVQTMCPYCQAQTTRGHVCFGAGSIMTFVEPSSSAMITCSCDVVNGAVQQVCHQPPSTATVTLPPYDGSTAQKSKGGTRRRRVL